MAFTASALPVHRALMNRSGQKFELCNWKAWRNSASTNLRSSWTGWTWLGKDNLIANAVSSTVGWHHPLRAVKHANNVMQPFSHAQSLPTFLNHHYYRSKVHHREEVYRRLFEVAINNNDKVLAFKCFSSVYLLKAILSCPKMEQWKSSFLKMSRSVCIGGKHYLFPPDH